MRGKKHYPFAEFRNVISRKRTRSSHKESENNGTSSSSSDNETTPKFKNIFGTNFNVKLDARMKTRCECIIKAYNELFQNRTRNPMFVLCSFQHFLNPNLDRLFIQQLECEMYSAGYPDKYNFFELGYCGHTQYPCSKIFLCQASDLTLSHFKEEDHLFISDALRDKKTQLVLLYHVYKPKTNTSRTKNTTENMTDDEKAYKFGTLYGDESTGFHCYMISVVVFSYSETLVPLIIMTSKMFLNWDIVFTLSTLTQRFSQTSK